MDRYEAADRVSLYIARALAMTGTVDSIDRVAVLAVVRRRLTDALDTAITEALSDGVTYAHLARLLGVSRQAVRQRHGPRRTVDIASPQDDSPQAP